MNRALAVVPLLMLACSGDRSSTAKDSGSEWIEHPPRYARSFTLLHSGESERVLVFGDPERIDTLAVIDLVSLETKAVRSAKHFPLTVPVARIATLNTTHASYIAALGAADRIRSMAYLDHVRDTVVQGLASRGDIRSLGPSENPDRELLVVQDPDVLFVAPFGGIRANLVPGGGIPVVPVCEYLEHTPLGRAEWIRFFGLLLGMEQEADSLFDAIEQEYLHTRALVEETDERPSVFFGSSWKGVWYVPSGNSHIAALVSDAGGQLMFDDRAGNENLTLDLETVLQEGRKARYWGRVLAEPGMVEAHDLSGGDPRIEQLPAFANRRLFYANSSKDDFFGQALLEPQVVLRDMVLILHPELVPGHVPRYFRSLGQ